jgi:hypothetical protein
MPLGTEMCISVPHRFSRTGIPELSYTHTKNIQHDLCNQKIDLIKKCALFNKRNVKATFQKKNQHHRSMTYKNRDELCHFHYSCEHVLNMQ